ncbi:MAG: SRPBCC family protein [Actinobacteria bacterium]|nr:SRPBCC family protein [Actinomycetota bacterium]
MTRWYQLERPDATTFTEATELFRFPARFAASPERVWDSLVSDASLAAWGLGVQSLHWTSPRPFGVGTTREVVLPLRAMTIREEFTRWDEGSGYSFHVREANRPGLRSFAENYELVPDGDGTFFTWTIALEPAPRFGPVLRAMRPANRRAFGLLVRGGARYFASGADQR